MASRTGFIATLLVVTTTLWAQDAPPSELRSPDGVYSVRILDKRLPGADRIFGDQTLVLYHSRKVLSQFPTTGYLLRAYWSPGGSSVAVNNRRGHDGDYLWVLSLRDGKAIRHPDDRLGDPKFFVPRITRKFPDCTEGGFFRYYLIAMGWQTANTLKVRTDVRFYHTNPADVLIDDVYRVSGNGFARVKESLGPAPPDA